MKRPVILFSLAALIIALAAIIRLEGPQRGRTRSSPAPVILTRRLHLLNADIEDKIIFYLSRKLGIYEGALEIIDVVNLDTRGISGADYILVTLKAPDGKLCQVTLSRGSLPWSEWELNPENSSAKEMPQSALLPYAENAGWMRDLGITRDEVIRYYIAHPEIGPDNNIERAFLDKETGIRSLPSDWWKAALSESRFRLEISKNKVLSFVSHMGSEDPLNSYWAVDYPLDYSGPGYRGYLYKKIKSE